MKKNAFLFSCLSIIILMLITQCKPVKTELSEDEFQDPSKDYRAMALWTWMNGYIDTAKLVFELEEMKDKGMRGAIIWDIGSLADPENIIPDGPAFLGKESLEYISLALKTCDRLGLDLGMVASSSWNAGGEWVAKEDASMQILSSRREVEGPGRKNIIMQAPVSRRGRVDTYSLISTLAMPFSDSVLTQDNIKSSINLDEFVRNDTLIEWDVPEGKWNVFSFYMCNTGQNLVCPSPNSDGLVIDHLSRIATERHFDSLLTRLDKVSTAESHLKILMLDSYEVWRMKDWTPGFIDEFKSRYNYDPVPYLPLLLGFEYNDTVVAERFRSDYSRLVSDLMIENHFAQSMEIAEKHGIQMLSEAGHGGSPRVDPLKALGNSHIPMGEFWNRQRFWVTKEAASAAHIYGRKLVAAESLTGWNHWQHGPADFKQLLDIAFCEGLNQIVFHTFAHNPAIAGKPGFTYHAGEHINVNTTWWEMVKPFMDYIGRCSYMLRQGLPVGDVCLYYGDQAPNLVPSKRIDPNIKQIFDDTQCLHCGQPKPVNPGKLPGFDYDYMNADIITNTLTVKNGKLVLPDGVSYRLILLPDREDISLEVLRKLERLVYNGAVIVGRKPLQSTSLKDYPDCDSEVKNLADKLWGDCDGINIQSNTYGKGIVYWGKSVQEVLEDLDIPPDLEIKNIENSDRHIDYIHRRTQSEEIYFISNSSQNSEKVSCIFRVDKNKVPEIWDAQTGLVQRKVEYSILENGISIEFVLDPLASRFVVFRNRTSGRNDDALTVDLQYGLSDENAKMILSGESDISDMWHISFDQNMGGPDSYLLKELTSWSDIDNDSVKYYSGTAVYSREFNIDSDLAEDNQVFLEFTDIQETARVFINGKDCGIVWLPPYRVNITPYIKTGSNEIMVKAINTWNNRIVGDQREPDKKTYTNTNIKNKFRESSPLLPSGLTGKAQLIFMKNVN